ncbi:MAG: sigma-70 family RNA polymerase sigma factor [bacterium]|nr:sigma-70 family RNA polymerase sigma factor [bacterium]
MALPSPADESESTDREAFAELVRTHQAAIWRYLRFLGCSVAEADDLTQDTFVAVFGRALHRFGKAGAAGYLRRVARNSFLKLRQADQATRTVSPAVAEAAFDWFCRRDDGERVVEALRRCVARLDPAARRALTQRYADDAPRSQIARDLGMSEHGVKSLLQRSYARLRACIQRRLADD